MMERAKIVAAIVDLGGEDGRAVSLNEIKGRFPRSASLTFEAALIQLRDADAIELSGLNLYSPGDAEHIYLPGVAVEGLCYEFVRLKKKIEPESPPRPHNT